MKPHKIVSLFSGLLLLGLMFKTAPAIHAATIYQTAGNNAIAFEAESVRALSNAPPTLWVITNDATASGGTAIYQAGDNGTASSSSFAYYSLKFSQPGTYYLFYRWRADKTRTDQDANGGNSFRVPINWGDLENDSTSSNFPSASVNNAVQVPAANSYNVFKDNQTYTVTQEQVDAGLPLTFKIGTREWGMFIDRIVLSQSDTLPEADFNALPNSETDLVVQGPGDDYVAFEAELVSELRNAAPTYWVVTNDVTASGGTAIYQAGDNGTASSSSFALYSLKPSQPGTYALYYRWRADKTRTDQDANGGNSFRVPIDWGDLENDSTSTNFPSASVNNAVQVPAANNYNVFKDNQTYTVTQEQVDAGQPLTFKIGTREWGMFIDRFVLSLRSDLTEADINALPNSGANAARPKLVKATGSAGMTNVTVFFDKPLQAGSVLPANFKLSGGVSVTSAVLNPTTSEDVLLTTSKQTAGVEYTVTVNNVMDVSGNAIAPNASTKFHAWQLASGWVTREFYFAVTGSTLSDLFGSPKFPGSPDKTDTVKGFQLNNDPRVDNYGARLTALFTPPITGVYEFFMYSDDEAELDLSSDESAANLQPILYSYVGPTNFDATIVAESPASLTAGRRYLLQGILKQGTGEAHLNVAARRKGDTTPPEQLTVLGGGSVSTYADPDAGIVTFKKQPQSVQASAATHAKFSVQVTTVEIPIYYRWEVDGVAIPDANRSVYITPVLKLEDSGKKYRVVIGVAGKETTSSEATLIVVPGEPSNIQPYIGINFVGAYIAGSGGSGASLYPTEVAGAVLQDHYNNIAGTSAAVPLMSGEGAETPVTLTYDALTEANSAIAETDADGALLRGYLHNTNAPLSVTLNGVPSGNYALLVYSVGFNYNATYQESISLTGGGSYPTYRMVAQHAGQYLAAPGFTRCTSTNENAWQTGNYVQFDNVSPALDGLLILSITPETTNTGIVALPPLNAMQLVKVGPVTAKPVLSIAPLSAGKVTLSWTSAAAGFVLETTTALGSGTSWAPAAGTPNPLTDAGSVAVTPSNKAFYRLRK